MFCRTCGNQLSDGVRFCCKCGTPVNVQPVPAQPIYMQSAPMQSASGQPGANMSGVAPGYGGGGMAQVPTKRPVGNGKNQKNKLVIVGVAGACLVVGIVVISLISSLLKKEETVVKESKYVEWNEEDNYEDSVDEDADSQEEGIDSEYEDNGEENITTAESDAVQEEEADDGLAQAYIMDDIKIQMVRAATNVGFQNPECWESCQYDDFGNMISASGEKGKAWWRYDDQGNVVSYEFIGSDGVNTTIEFVLDAQGRFAVGKSKGMFGRTELLYKYADQGYLEMAEDYDVIDGRVIGAAAREFYYNEEGVIRCWDVFEIDGGRGYYFDPRGEW